jgi:4-diphosphocytidyl-2-C-methyl-D-erythritol kinase
MDLRTDNPRIARAPAKLNLFLEVLGRRDDGFHELETLMVPIQLADQVALTPIPAAGEGPAAPIDLYVQTCWPVCSPSQEPACPSGHDNLVVRALERLRERSDCRLGARVELVKRIPMGAGLGGGSSDAAAALRLANRAWQLDWDDDQLAGVAAELGSDVPFFMSHGAAICRGRGESIDRLPPLSPIHFVIVKPPVGLSTSEVYRAHDSLPATDGCPSRFPMLQEIVVGLNAKGSFELRHWMHNGLQRAASLICSWVEKLSSVFERLDCLAHQLSGSGSAYFGVCRHAQHARRLASILRTQHLGLVFATRSWP